MHESSLKKMSLFVQNHLSGLKSKKLRILDVGSTDINGSYKEFFNQPGWQYEGADLAAGNNVDIVLHDNYNWKNIKSDTYDVVISGQAFEHIEFYWVTILEIARVLKSGGICCIIAPSGGIEHKYPVDCWRFYPDGFRALARYANLKLLETYAEFQPDKYNDASELWMDCVLVAEKLPYSVKSKFVFKLKSFLGNLLLRL
jgi:SAM-dependent methyltransferase